MRGRQQRLPRGTALLRNTGTTVRAHSSGLRVDGRAGAGPPQGHAPCQEPFVLWTRTSRWGRGSGPAPVLPVILWPDETEGRNCTTVSCLISTQRMTSPEDKEEIYFQGIVTHVLRRARSCTPSVCIPPTCDPSVRWHRWGYHKGVQMAIAVFWYNMASSPYVCCTAALFGGTRGTQK